MKVLWPDRTGSLCAWMSRGFNRQDANGLLVVLCVSKIIQGGGIAATLDASYYKGSGARNGKEREFVAIETEPVVCPDVCTTNIHNRSDPKPGDPASSLTTDSRNYMVQSVEPNRKYIVRRLTPVECARLQGFPDWWCDGADGSDSAQYKLWGNGIALPCAVDVLGRIARAYRRGW